VWVFLRVPIGCTVAFTDSPCHLPIFELLHVTTHDVGNEWTALDLSMCQASAPSLLVMGASDVVLRVAIEMM
jgi:hypothetical protein